VFRYNGRFVYYTFNLLQNWKYEDTEPHINYVRISKITSNGGIFVGYRFEIPSQSHIICNDPHVFAASKNRDYGATSKIYELNQMILVDFETDSIVVIPKTNLPFVERLME
jgi:hypothetical protein